MPDVSAPAFALRETLASGQTFRWKEHDGWCYGIAGAAALKVRQEGDRLRYETSDPAFTEAHLRAYFALDLNLEEILDSIDRDIQVHQAIARYRGLRVLRQDPWETLASFICASFNNITRIEGMIERLCQAFGDPVSLHGFRGFGFPTAERLASVSERRLRALGLGYRAPYLRAAARLVADRRLPLTHLRRLGYEDTKRALLACDGVGDKVADCVALFGFEQYAAFPVDVWMERAMRYYFRHRRMTRGRLHAYAQRHFGPYCGYAQQYLYHHVRHLRPSANPRGECVASARDGV